MNSILLYLIWISFQLADHENATIPINKLSDHSEYIVNTKLLSVNTIQTDSQFYAIANLKVLETIKGDTEKDTIEVIFDPRNAYPPNPEFYRYASNIAFLNKEDLKYKVFGSSKGVKQFHDSEEAVEYSERIKAYLEIAAEETIDSVKIVNWVIDNFKYRSTAEEAIEFLGQSFTNERCIKEGTPKSTSIYNSNVFLISHLLSAQNKQDIRTAFVDGKVKDNTYSFTLLTQFYDPKDQKFEAFVLTFLRKCVNSNYRHGTMDFIKDIHKVVQNEALNEIYEALIKVPITRKHDAESLELMDQYLKVLGY